MRRWLTGPLTWLALGGLAVVAPPVVVGAAPVRPTVVIEAALAPAAHMATYPGPGATRIPTGACAAVVQGRVWVLPCHDPRVVASRQAIARGMARRRHRRAEVLAALAVALGTLGGGFAEAVGRRAGAGRGV